MASINFRISIPVINAIEKRLLINWDQLKCTCRDQELVNARIIFTHFHYTLFNMGPTEVGRLLNRNHSTVVHYTKCHERFTDTKDLKYMQAYTSVTELMQLETAIEEMLGKIEMTSEWLKTNFNHPDVKLILEDRNRYRVELAELTHKLNILTNNK